MRTASHQLSGSTAETLILTTLKTESGDKDLLTLAVFIRLCSRARDQPSHAVLCYQLPEAAPHPTGSVLQIQQALIKC